MTSVAKEVQAAAEQLWQARESGSLYEGNGHPVDLSSAYALQKVASSLSGELINGWKIGATVEALLEMMNLEEPFFGPLFQSKTRENGASVPVHIAHQPKIEAEFVVCLKTDLGRNTRGAGAGDITADEVREAIDWIAPGFEFIGTRFKETPTGRGFCTVADFGSNLDMVVGEREYNWQEMDLDRLPVTLNINGTEVGSGHSGMSAAGSPLKLIAWMLNNPHMPADGLKAGQIVSCGTCTGADEVKPGDAIEADYGRLGRLSSAITTA